MSGWKKEGMIFALGALGYTGIELLWRGYTHWTMGVAGGLCFWLLYYMLEEHSKKSLPSQCGLSVGLITVMEFSIGCVVNLILGWQVWDYAKEPWNLMGQVCLRYSLYWLLLSVPICLVCRLLQRRWHT